MSRVSEPPPEPAATPVRSSGSRLAEWLRLRDAIAAAEASAPPATARELRDYGRAHVALEVGDRAMDPTDPFLAGTAQASAVEAYRQSVFWSLGLLGGRGLSGDSAGDEAREEAGAQDTVETRFRLASPALNLDLSDEALARVAVVLSRSFVEDAHEADEVLRADAELLGRLARVLVHRAEGPERRVAGLRRQSRRRMALATVLLALFCAAAVSALRPHFRKPDIARGKPWRASSTLSTCQPENHTCAGSTDTAIFFHTTEEESPWVEIDLGAPGPVSSLLIRNRDDCCKDRAIPLIAEVATEPGKWREVARRTKVFDTWEPSFAPTQARYVRLRVGRKSFLHLSTFAVHR